MPSDLYLLHKAEQEIIQAQSFQLHKYKNSARELTGRHIWSEECNVKIKLIAFTAHLQQLGKACGQLWQKTTTTGKTQLESTENFLKSSINAFRRMEWIFKKS